MRRLITLAALLCLIPFAARAQAPDLQGMSFTKTVTVSAGEESRTFRYEMFVRDDWRAGSVTPVISSVKLGRVRVVRLDSVVTADVLARAFTDPEGAPASYAPLTGVTAFDPRTGLPATQLLAGTASDKNGRRVEVRVRVTFSDWRRRKVEVRVLDIGDVDDGP